MQFAKLGGFCELSLFFQEKHSEFTKTPQICEPACESAFLWFGLPGRLLNVLARVWGLAQGSAISWVAKLQGDKKPDRGPQTYPKSRNNIKHRVDTNFFEKFARTFPILPSALRHESGTQRKFFGMKRLSYLFYTLSGFLRLVATLRQVVPSRETLWESARCINWGIKRVNLSFCVFS